MLVITNNDIRRFIEEEQTQVKKEIESNKKLSIEKKVLAGRAIVGVKYDSSYSESYNNYGLFRFIIEKNQSSLDVGDSVLVNEIEGTLWNYDYFGNLIIGFWGRAGIPFNCFVDDDIIVEKNDSNFLAPLYQRFLSSLPKETNSFWNENVIPSRKSVVYDGAIGPWKQSLISIERKLGIQLLDSQRDAVAHALAASNYYMLQGPPGTGKTFIIALIAIIHAFFLNERVCVAGPNYKAINNALVKIGEMLPNCIDRIIKVGYPFQTAGLTFKSGNETLSIENYDGKLDISQINELKNLVMGMTPYTFYSSRAADITFDTVILDESGQMSIPVAMMAILNCKKFILCGDHKQLTPIIRAENIVEPLKQSIFKYMLNEDNCSLLDVSFRMNESICRIVSDLFYEGKLKSYNPESRLVVDVSDAFLSGDNSVVAKNISSTGKFASTAEADEIDSIIRAYYGANIEARLIGVLAPFRAQCSTIRRKLFADEDIPDTYKKEIVVDTIDKLQGQERDIIILSLISGDIDYINKFCDFLYNPNKLNVAISRAKSKLIVLGNFDVIRTMSGYEDSYIKKFLDHSECVLID